MFRFKFIQVREVHASNPLPFYICTGQMETVFIVLLPYRNRQTYGTLLACASILYGPSAITFPL